MPFRLNAQYLFLTYPQSGSVTKQDLKEFLYLEGDAEFGVIAQEKHSDGSNHLHAYVKMDKKIDRSSEKCFDFKNLHGNYQGVVHPVECLNYVTKGDDYITFGILDIFGIRADAERRGKKPRVWDEIGNDVTAGKSVKEIVLKAPRLFEHLRRIEDAVAQHALWSIPEKPTFHGLQVAPCAILRIGVDTVVNWVNSNVKCARAFKQKQLYLSGPPNCGKTSLISTISQYVNVYFAPYDGEWFDDYSDDYDLIVFDEFRGQYTIQFLNRLLEGSVCPLRRRGKAPVLKKKNTPCMFLSNYQPHQVYTKASAEKVDAFIVRLETVVVSEFISVEAISASPTTVVTSAAVSLSSDSPALGLGDASL